MLSPVHLFKRAVCRGSTHRRLTSTANLAGRATPKRSRRSRAPGLASVWPDLDNCEREERPARSGCRSAPRLGWSLPPSQARTPHPTSPHPVPLLALGWS